MRYKKVFNTSDCITAFYNYNKDDSKVPRENNEGRSNNTFWIANKFYSYDYHFLACEIITYDKKKYAIINSDTYSNTTAGHLSELECTCPFPKIYASMEGDFNLPQALECEAIKILGLQEKAGRARLRDYSNAILHCLSNYAMLEKLKKQYKNQFTLLSLRKIEDCNNQIRSQAKITIEKQAKKQANAMKLAKKMGEKENV